MTDWKPELRVSAVIPCFNAESSICSVVSEVLATGITPVVVVDDASTDDSWTTLANLFEGSSSKVILLRHDSNQGVGAAMKTGYRYLLENFNEIDVVVKIDADGQMAVDDLPSYCNRFSRVGATMPRETDSIVQGASGVCQK